MKYILPILMIVLVSCKTTHLKEEHHIRQVMKAQEDAWNRGSIDDFMKGYWNSDSLTFIGSRGPTYGYQTTLENYKKGYPNKERMGELRFDVINLKRLSKSAYVMLGKYTLKRANDEPLGYFTLIWEKIDGTWVITSDQSS